MRNSEVSLQTRAALLGVTAVLLYVHKMSAE
jgi:hypothetical protein